MMKHQNCSQTNFHCIACNIPFDNFDDQKRHYFAFHSKNAISTSFTTPSALSDKVSSNKAVEFKCESCDEKFSSTIAYDFHTQGKKHKAAVENKNQNKGIQRTNGKLFSDAKNSNSSSKNNFIKKTEVKTKEEKKPMPKTNISNGIVTVSNTNRSIKKEKQAENTPRNVIINKFIKKKDIKLKESDMVISNPIEEQAKKDHTAEIIHRIKERVTRPITIKTEKNIQEIPNHETIASEMKNKQNGIISDDLCLRGVNDILVIHASDTKIKNGEVLTTLDSNSKDGQVISNFVNNEKIKNNATLLSSDISKTVWPKIPHLDTNKTIKTEVSLPRFDISKNNCINNPFIESIPTINHSLSTAPFTVGDDSKQQLYVDSKMKVNHEGFVWCDDPNKISRKSIVARTNINTAIKKEVDLIPFDYNICQMKSEKETSTTICNGIKLSPIDFTKIEKNKTQKGKDQYACTVCNIQCTSINALEAHMVGKLHLKSLSQNKSIDVIDYCNNILKASNGNVSPLVPQNKTTINGYIDINELYCEACHARCNSAKMYNMHVTSPKHLRVQRIFNQRNRVIECSNSKTITRESCHVTCNSTESLELHCNNEEHRNTIGINKSKIYNNVEPKNDVTEDFVATRNDINESPKPYEFRCDNCLITCNSMEDAITHLSGPDHTNVIKMKIYAELKNQKDMNFGLPDVFKEPKPLPLSVSDDTHKRQCKTEPEEAKANNFIAGDSAKHQCKDYSKADEKKANSFIVGEAHKRKHKEKSEAEPDEKKTKTVDMIKDVNFCRYCLLHSANEVEALEHYQSPGHIANFEKLKDKKYPCGICNLQFKWDKELEKHLSGYGHYAVVNKDNMNPTGKYADQLVAERVNRCMKPPRRITYRTKFGEPIRSDSPPSPPATPVKLNGRIGAH